MDTLFSDLPRTRAEAKAIGSKYYFTNKACKNGHISKRIVRNNNCYECKLERSKSYRESNRDAIREQKKNYNKAYYAAKVGKTPEEIGTRRTQEPARYVYFLVVKDEATNEKLFLKVGITNNPSNRLKQHSRRLAKHGLIFDTILVKDFQTEEAARTIELKIKSSFMVYESGIKGFTDECFMYLPQFEQSMKMLLCSANVQRTC